MLIQAFSLPKDTSLLKDEMNSAKIELWRKQGRSADGRSQYERIWGFQQNERHVEGIDVLPVKARSYIEQERVTLRKMIGGLFGGRKEPDAVAPGLVNVDMLESEREREGILAAATAMTREQFMQLLGKLFPEKSATFFSDTLAYLPSVRFPQDMRAVHVPVEAQKRRQDVEVWAASSFGVALTDVSEKNSLDGLFRAIADCPVDLRQAFKDFIFDLKNKPSFAKADFKSVDDLFLLSKEMNDFFFVPNNVFLNSYKPNIPGKPNAFGICVDRIERKVDFPYEEGNIPVYNAKRLAPKPSPLSCHYDDAQKCVVMYLEQIASRLEEYTIISYVNEALGSAKLADGTHFQNAKNPEERVQALYTRVLSEELRHGMDLLRVNRVITDHREMARSGLLMKEESQLRREFFRKTSPKESNTLLEVSGQMTAAAIDPLVLNEWGRSCDESPQPGPHWFAGRIALLMMGRELGCYSGGLSANEAVSSIEAARESFIQVAKLSANEFRLLLKKVYEKEFTYPIDELPFPRIDEKGVSHERISWDVPKEKIQEALKSRGRY